MQLKETLHLVLGATLGLVGAAGLASLWSRYGHRVNLGLFLPGDGHLPVRLRRAAAHRRRARRCPSRTCCRSADRSTRQPSRGVPTQRVRSCADLHAGSAACRMAGAEGAAGRHIPQGRDRDVRRTQQPRADLLLMADVRPPLVAELCGPGDCTDASTRHEAAPSSYGDGQRGPSPMQRAAIRACGLHGRRCR